MRLAVVVAIAILLALMNSAWASGKPRQSGNAAIYAASIFLRASLFLGGLLFLFLALGFAYTLGWPWSLPFFAFAICTVIGWPPTILVDANQVKQVRFLRTPIVIAKTNIASIEYDSGTHKTSVSSTEGDQIVHQRFHVASEDFRRRLAAWHRISENAIS
jgi:MFS family permease